MVAGLKLVKACADRLDSATNQGCIFQKQLWSHIFTNKVHWNLPPYNDTFGEHTPDGLQAAPQNIAFISLNYLNLTSSY